MAEWYSTGCMYVYDIAQDDDRGSVVSETSTSSLESLHHSQSTTSSTKTDTLSTDFSPGTHTRQEK